MKHGKLIGFVVAVVTALALAVPAFAEGPPQRYGSPTVTITTKPSQPAAVSGGKTSPSGTTPVPRKGGLPYTGAQLGLFTVIGLALIGGGLLLRLTARKPRRLA
jgi:LPXTG-motif cell wall-anchored protein